MAAEIWICRLRNQILWRRECQRHSGEGSFSAFSAARPCLFPQNSFPINGRNENKGRNITRHAVSIKPHSRLTNKVETAEKQPNASPSWYLNVLDSKNIECQCYCFDLCVVLFLLRGYLTSSWSSPGGDSPTKGEKS